MTAVTPVRVNVRKGLDLQLGDQPTSGFTEEKVAASAAVLGRNFPGIKFDLKVKPGMRLHAGEPVACDRRRRDIVFTSPASGIVKAVNLGKRRSLSSISIDVDQNVECKSFNVPDSLQKGAVRKLMLNSGLWTAVRSRPFGHVPDPDREPLAMLVTAIDTDPLAPDPVPIVSARTDEFELGLQALGAMCDAPLYLCRRPAVDIARNSSSRAQHVEFAGPHPAGLPGTHIHFLCPIGVGEGEVWYVGYQDVIALGHLLHTGKLWLQRVVSLAGPAATAPRVVTVSLAGATDDLVAGELRAGPVKVISGSALSGHAAVGAEAFLGQHHRQITVLSATDAKSTHWGRRVDFAVGLGGAPGPMIPMADLERLSPPGVLPVPLMRSLLVGDIERAKELGALELIEEDLALLSYACPSKSDYGQLLRSILEQLHREAA